MPDSTTEPKLITVGVIAAETRSSIAKVLYVLATRHHIRPAARAGIIRLYDLHAISLVRHELNAIAARHSARDGGAHVQ